MRIVKATDLRKEWNGRTLFENVSFEVEEGERIALVGRNGCGKTTLLQGLLGRLPFEAGSVRRDLPLEQWGWLDQRIVPESAGSPLAFVQSGSPELYRAKRTLESLQRRMEGAAGAEADADMLERYGEAYDTYLRLGGYEWEAKTERSLRLMGLAPALWTLPFASLSGGQQTRAQLAALLVREPAFIVLDEPTNCLDIDARERVEEALQAYPDALLIVSHDRTLIRAVANRLVILDPRGEPRFFAGTVAEYEEAAEQGRLRALSAEERERADERGLLELRLAEWMSRDVPDEEAQRQMLMAEICRLRRKMEELSDQER